MGQQQLVLEPGKDIITLEELEKRVAAYKELKLVEGAPNAYSENIMSCSVTAELLKHLAERRIVQQPRPDCNDKIFTLVDENPQQKVPGWAPSNYWNFKLVKDGKRQDLVLTLCVGLTYNQNERGFALWLLCHSTMLSPASDLPNFRMFKAIVEKNPKAAPAVAREIAASDGHIVVTWTDLGLGGIRQLNTLFQEFAGDNAKVLELRYSEGIFNPVPDKRWEYTNHHPGKLPFITEPAQPRVLQAWHEQLEQYRSKLVA